MSGLLRVGGYAVGLIGAFTAFSYYGIPQIVPEPPPAVENVTSAATVDELVAAGGRIYVRACELCHSGIGDRAPKLDAVATAWRERIGDPRYRGKATDLEQYLRESLLQPSVYVVKGFGKPGTDDTESPMPEATKGALALSPGEIDAVIAYLQSRGGATVTVRPQTAPAAAATPAPTEQEAGAKAPDAIAALRKFQCDVCHHLPGVAAEDDTERPGPDLRQIRKTAASRVNGVDPQAFVTESILLPNKVLAPGFEPGLMPDDFSDRMLVSELQMIVRYLTGDVE